MMMICKEISVAIGISVLSLAVLYWQDVSRLVTTASERTPTDGLGAIEIDLQETHHPDSLSSFLVNGHVPWADRASLPPVELLREYMAQHSEQALQLAWE